MLRLPSGQLATKINLFQMFFMEKKIIVLLSIAIPMVADVSKNVKVSHIGKVLGKIVQKKMVTWQSVNSFEN
jgi:hypothetical protein